MRRSSRLLIPPTLIVFSALLSGCQGGMPPRRVAAASEPALNLGEPGTEVAAAPRSGGDSFVDRHPLFSKPRDFYESSGDNPVVKTAAAAVVGIPAGVVGELRQIVVGKPRDPY